MALKMKEIHRMNEGRLKDQLKKFKQELMQVKAQLSSGGSVENNGQMKEIRKTIARIKTVQRERKEA
ncbi:MAG: 50S ribosomal protein L29 [Candidatus Heimdallarchaeota archaeon]|nr:50S ribosomal protein L29 [Candidatus Heimdallarchaeota archaeon]MCK5048157.1 50S ribosomal protein L29 [Candidatus Heimdallarchaeota archaeon]